MTVWTGTNAKTTLTTLASRKGSNNSATGRIDGVELNKGTGLASHDLDLLDRSETCQRSLDLGVRDVFDDTLK